MHIFAVLALVALLVGCGGSTTAPAPVQKAAEQPAAAVPKTAAEAPSAAQSKPVVEAKPAADRPVASGPTRLTMGTPPSTSGTYAYTVALAKLLQTRVPDLSITVSEGAGAPLNGKRLLEGKFDFAIVTFGALYAVYSGLDPAFTDQPMKEARALWVVNPLAQVWFVREDSGVTSPEQLQGKDFSPGGKGTGTELLARQLIFSVLGIAPRWYLGGMEDAAAALKDRRIVGMGKGTALKVPDSLLLDAMATMKIRILSWTPEQVQQVKAKYPFMTTADIPAGTYKAPWNEKPLPAWGEGSGMFTLAKFPEPLAYAFTKAVVEDHRPGGEQIQATAYPTAKDFDITAATMEYATVPLHAGSYRYFREIGAKIPDHLKSLEAK